MNTPTYRRVVAGNTSLMASKMKWAEGLAEVVAKHISSAGAWRNYGLKITTDTSYGRYGIQADSKEYGFTIFVDFFMEGNPYYEASLNKTLSPEDAEKEDFFQFLERVDGAKSKKEIDESKEYAAISSEITIYLSKLLPPADKW